MGIPFEVVLVLVGITATWGAISWIIDELNILKR